MPEAPAPIRSSDNVVRAAVAAAEATRRGRRADRRLWRVAPIVAVVCLAAALVSRWAALGMTVPAGFIIVGIAALGIDAVLQRRRQSVSDAVAARIDADGGFGGELRSATWFASRESRDEWAAFHVDHAATRLAGFDWNRLYPPVRARRAQAATGVMLVVAVATTLSIQIQGRIAARPGAPVAAAKGVVPGKLGARIELLPEELRKQLEELIAAAERGALSNEQQKRAVEFWNLLAQINADLDPDKLKELAKAMDPLKSSSDAAAKNLMDLATRAQKAADAKAISPEAKRALENLGDQLAQASQAEQQAATEAQNASGQSSGKDAQAGNAASSEAPAKLDQSSIQFSKENESGAGASLMMMSQQTGPKGQPSSGFGGAGNSGTPPNNGVMPELEQALRRETIEASEDQTGDNVLSETRRKTERGQATVGFTHSTSGPSDRSRASAPPPVPEGRRSAVQTYFTRKK